MPQLKEFPTNEFYGVSEQAVPMLQTLLGDDMAILLYLRTDISDIRLCKVYGNHLPQGWRDPESFRRKIQDRLPGAFSTSTQSQNSGKRRLGTAG